MVSALISLVYTSIYATLAYALPAYQTFKVFEAVGSVSRWQAWLQAVRRAQQTSAWVLQTLANTHARMRRGRLPEASHHNLQT